MRINIKIKEKIGKVIELLLLRLMYIVHLEEISFEYLKRRKNIVEEDTKLDKSEIPRYEYIEREKERKGCIDK
jgi:hypothetical protein